MTAVRAHAHALAPVRDETEVRLLEDFQRDFPLEPRPFATMASSLGIAEASVLGRLQALKTAGIIARVGGVVQPNTLAASTLAAMSAPPLVVEDVAAVLERIDGINHVYLRENALNIWFVATGPDRAHVSAALQQAEQQTGLRVLDLRLERPYHIDLGFSLLGAQSERHHTPDSDAYAFEFEDGDRALVQVLTDGLPIVPRPFREVATKLGRGEATVIDRLKILTAAGIVPRIGVIVRHRALGWRSNAMVVWDIPPPDVDRLGALLSRQPGINLCYRRTRYERDWPYNLYCMVHARSREEALDTIVEASGAAGLDAHARQILFSLRCFKQTGALVSRREAH